MTGIKVEVALNNAGILSNTLHFLDLFEMLTGERINFVSEKSLSFFESKRSGFFEAKGKFIAGIDCSTNYGALEISDLCNSDIAPSCSVKIKTHDMNIEINETEGLCVFNERGNRTFKNFDIAQNYQSTLSKQLVYDTLDQKTCKLPSVESALKLNRLFLEAIQKHGKDAHFT